MAVPNAFGARHVDNGFGGAGDVPMSGGGAGVGGAGGGGVSTGTGGAANRSDVIFDKPVTFDDNQVRREQGTIARARARLTWRLCAVRAAARGGVAHLRRARHFRASELQGSRRVQARRVVCATARRHQVNTVLRPHGPKNFTPRLSADEPANI